MTYSAIAKKAMKLRTDRPFQQFGQANDYATQGGAVGCTDSCLQYFALLWTGKWYTHDRIRQITGAPRTRGLRPDEVQAFCNYAKLPYQVRYGLTANTLLQLSAKGPVGFGHSYSYWPEWRGYRYAGRTADGYPNGYAGPLNAAGRTQLAGFVPPNDAHFGIVLGYDGSLSTYTRRVAAFEPNHDSPSRPENPPYDQMTSAQFRKVYESYRRVLGRSLYALVPTRSLPL